MSTPGHTTLVGHSNLATLETSMGQGNQTRMIEELSAGIDTWRRQEPQPLAITPARQAPGQPHLTEPSTQLPLNQMKNPTGYLLQPLTKPTFGNHMGSGPPPTYTQICVPTVGSLEPGTT